MAVLKHIISLLLLTVCYFSYGQGGFSLKSGEKHEKVKFDFVNNLIILPVTVNGVELSFILDTGVNKPILFNITQTDSVKINNSEKILIKGLGDGEPVEAIHSKNNRFQLGDVFNYNQDFYLIADSSINFSPRIGYRVHGIIGYDLLKNFIVEVDYSAEKIKFYDPDAYSYKRCRKCETLPLTIEGSKAYINANIKQYTTIEEINVKLLLDSGSCDAIWLFENNEQAITGPIKFFDDFLGFGLSGKIHGKRARVQRFGIGDFELHEAKVAYPDSTALQYITRMDDRNGSVGSEILKRFDMVLDYPNAKITLKKNGSFNNPFKYNMSGIELQHNGLRLVKQLVDDVESGYANTNENGIKVYTRNQFSFELHPALEIAQIRENSPAALVGLKEGDVIVKVNNRSIYRYTLQEVSEMINEREGKKVNLTIDRKGSILKFSFELVKVL
ncbi:PDZ domain-containing protein [Galbibacter sp. PAP.153]|uniref:PDZ domain-containing protein n=1 Tax=Galbibacter sp. PAP.153 TaxID=3104623 RepID=UPI00300A61FE